MTYGITGYLAHAAFAASWNQVKLGGGGFVTGMDIAPDGTRIVRTDTAGAYLWPVGASTWSQILTVQRMPVADRGPGKFNGVSGVAVSYSNSQRMYMYASNANPNSLVGYVFRSDNGGSTWTRTGFSSIWQNPNGGSPRFVGPVMRVDPQNPDICYLGTWANGIWVTTDAGVTWAAISTASIAAAGSGFGYTVQFDPNSGVVGGKKQGIYVSSYGTGVYHSTNGGTSWTLLNSTGMPTTHESAFCDQAGVYWIVDGAFSLRRYNGAWANMSALMTGGDATVLTGVCVDPTNSSKVYAMPANGKKYNSTDGGTTWQGESDYSIATSPIGWPHAAEDPPSANHLLGCAIALFDPSLSNTIVSCGGIGVFTTQPTTTSASIVWTPNSLGLENLDATDIRSVPNGGPLLLSAQDRPTWVISNLSAYPSNYFPNYNNDITWGHSTNFAMSNTSVFWANNEPIQGGSATGAYKSTNGGATWAFCSSQPAVFGVTSYGGPIAAWDASVAVWAMQDDVGPYYTANGGASWAACTTGASNLLGWGHNATFSPNTRLCADGVDANTFYIYNDGNQGATASDVGVYKSTNGGANFSKVSGVSLTASASVFFGLGKLKSVYGKSGHLFLCSGADPNGTLPNTESLFRSTDHGVTWAALPNVASLFGFGFGASSGGSGYPSLFIVGYVSGVYGAWRSDNADQATPTWTNIGDGYPTGNYDFIICVEGDYNVAGRCYVGFLGSGFAYYG